MKVHHHLAVDAARAARGRQGWRRSSSMAGSSLLGSNPTASRRPAVVHRREMLLERVETRAPTAPGRAPASVHGRAGARGGPGRRGAAHRSGTRPARPGAAPADAWTPPAGSCPWRRRGPPPGAPAPAAGRGSGADSVRPAPRTSSPPVQYASDTYITVKSWNAPCAAPGTAAARYRRARSPSSGAMGGNEGDGPRPGPCRGRSYPRAGAGQRNPTAGSVRCRPRASTRDPAAWSSTGGAASPGDIDRASGDARAESGILAPRQSTLRCMGKDGSRATAREPPSVPVPRHPGLERSDWSADRPFRTLPLRPPRTRIRSRRSSSPWGACTATPVPRASSGRSPTRQRC